MVDWIPETVPVIRNLKENLPRVPAPLEEVAEGGPVFFTGQMRSGKDFIAERLDRRETAKVATPMWAVLTFFFGQIEKGRPGIREMMQEIGRLGRGDWGPGFTPTPSRGSFIQSVRNQGHELNRILRREEGTYRAGPTAAHHVPAYPPVDWDRFGRAETFWLDILCSHLDTRQEAGEDLPAPAVTDVRYPGSAKRLLGRGFNHVHVTVEEETRIERGAPPFRDDRTEALGDELDFTWAAPSEAPHGDMTETLAEECPEALRRVASGASVVWSDPDAQTPGHLTDAEDLIRLSKIYPAYAPVTR